MKIPSPSQGFAWGRGGFPEALSSGGYWHANRRSEFVLGAHPQSGYIQKKTAIMEAEMDRSQERPSNLSALKSSSLLSALTEEELLHLAQVSRMFHAKRSETIWYGGAPSIYFGLVATGFVKMVQTSPKGTEAMLEIMGPGQVFGLNAALQGMPCPLTARAVTEVWYLRIPIAEFLPIFKRNNAFKERLIRRSAMRLHEKLQFMGRTSKGSVSERIASVLMLLVDQYSVREKDGWYFTVPLTRQDVADMAGTTLESAIRVLSRWQKQGLVRTENHHIVILKRDQLEKLAKG